MEMKLFHSPTRLKLTKLCLGLTVLWLFSALLIAADAPLQLTIKNNSGYSDDQVFFMIIDSNSNTYFDFDSNTIQPFIAYSKDASGNNAQAKMIKSMQEISSLYGSATIPIPGFDSARVYYSFGQKLSDLDGGFTNVPGISSTVKILYDKFEFASSKGDNNNCNTTNVDFFAVPVTLTGYDTGAKKTISLGMETPQDSIFNLFNTIAVSPTSQNSGNTAIFTQMLVKDDSGKIVRILSPNHGGYTDFTYDAAQGINGPQWNSHFFDDYINNFCWKSGRVFQCYSKLYPNDTTVYQGEVSTDGKNTLSLYKIKSDGSKEPYKLMYDPKQPPLPDAPSTLPRPSSAFGTPDFITNPPYFSNTGVNGTGADMIDWGFLIAANSGWTSGPGQYWNTDPVAMSIIVSICRGVMHHDDGKAKWIDNTYFYQGENGSSTANYPIYYYAKILHDVSINNKCYALGYDDVFGQNTTITFGTNPAVTLTIQPFSAPADTTVTMQVSGSGSTVPTAGEYKSTYHQHVAYKIVANPDSGNHFTNWTVTGGTPQDSKLATTYVTFSSPTAVVTANFAPNTTPATLTMAASPAAGGSAKSSNDSPYVGESITITATAASGYHFTGWSAAGAKIPDSDQSTTSAIIKESTATITANFAQQQTPATLTMAVSPADSGTARATGSETGHYIGESLTISATAAAGYHFTGWTATGAEVPDSGHATTGATINASTATITALFTKQETPATLTISVSPESSGTTTPSGTYSTFVNKSVKIDAHQASGYSFTGWTGTGVTIAAAGQENTSVIVNEATATVTANFKAQEVATTLTSSASPTAGGWTTPTQLSCDVGQSVTVKAQPNSGYHFTGWTGSNVVIAQKGQLKTSVKVTAENPSVTATFAEDANAVSLTMAVSPEGGGTTYPATGSSLVDSGESFAIKATPASGYYFVGWLNGNSSTFVHDVTSSNSSAELSGNGSITAVFSTTPVTPVSLGSVTDIAYSDLSSADDAEDFSSKPKVTVYYTCPTGGKKLKTPMSVVTKVNKKDVQSTVQAEWRKKVALFNKKNYKDKTKSMVTLISEYPFTFMLSDKVDATYKPLGKEPITLKKTICLMPPVITDVDGSHSAAGDEFTVVGSFFGQKAPKVSVEYTVTKGKGDKQKTQYLYKNCKLNKTATYLYMDAKRKALKSCMKIYSDDTTDTSEVGHSTVTVEYPKFNLDKQTPTGYIIINNGIGISYFKLQD